MSEAVWLNPDNLGRFVVNILAVAGGFLIGYVGMYYGLPALLKLATARLINVPGWLRQILSLVSGVLAGWLVSLLVFGAGGGSWFPGGGGLGSGSGTGTGKDGATGSSTIRETAPDKGTGRDTNPPAELVLRVEVLNYADGQFIADTHRYRLKDAKELKTLEEIEAAIDRQMPKKFERLEIWVYLNSPDKDTLPVKELLNLGKRKGLTATLTLPQTQSP